jgi:hypothetical protein
MVKPRHQCAQLLRSDPAQEKQVYSGVMCNALDAMDVNDNKLTKMFFSRITLARIAISR